VGDLGSSDGHPVQDTSSLEARAADLRVDAAAHPDGATPDKLPLDQLSLDKPQPLADKLSLDKLSLDKLQPDLSCTPITACKAGDGCCPASCNKNTDPDCAAICGNGAVESGESCDTAITSGAGACPTSCGDGKACTADSLLSGGTCQAACAFTPITACASGDGCCPSGCHNNNDADCPAVCGNGVLEAGETCDKGIAAGAGACPGACDDGVACTKDTLVGAGTCQAKCSHAVISSCTSGDSCCPAGCNYLNDGDCSMPCASLSFDGSDYVDCTSSGDFDFGLGPFTIEAWFKTSVVAGKYSPQNILLSKEGSAGMWALSVGTNLIDFGIGIPSVCDVNYNLPISITNQWTHVAIQRQGGTITIFVNGVGTSFAQPNVWQSGSKDASTYSVTNNGALNIGRRANAGQYFVGTVAEVRITRAALYAGNFTPSKSLTPLAQTVGLYPLRDGAGSIAVDHSGKAHHGTAWGATWATDCPAPASCGNGVLDPAEKCDTVIPSGSPGACPTSCNDGVACTSDGLLNAGTCQAECAHTTITSCASGDGCCPPGCNNNNDKDCPVVCGNGFVEVGETCDKAISAGNPGACPTSCFDGKPCSADTLLNPGSCQATCANPPITACVGGDGCCPTGCTHLGDSDCPCYSLSFNGTTSYVEVPAHADLNPGTGDFTIDAWVKFDAGNHGTFVSKRDGENYYKLASNFVMWFVAPAGWLIEWTDPQPAVVGQWGHVAFQRKNGVAEYFVNGAKVTTNVQVNSGSSNPSAYEINNTGPLLIGKQPAGEHFAGKIAELRITNAAIYTGNFSPPTQLTSLAQTVALYHFDEGSGFTLVDSSGKGHNGTIYGALWSTSCP